MSKSMPVMIDTHDAILLITSTATETSMVTTINHLLSKISQSTYLDQSSTSIPSAHQSFSTVANTINNGQTTTTTTTTLKQTIKNSNNIKVIVPRYQNAASTKNSKSHTNILPIGLAFAVCVLLMLFLVMSSICLIKQRRKSMECDKKMLIGRSARSASDVVNGSECELNITKRNIYLV